MIQLHIYDPSCPKYVNRFSSNVTHNGNEGWKLTFNFTFVIHTNYQNSMSNTSKVL